MKHNDKEFLWKLLLFKDSSYLESFFLLFSASESHCAVHWSKNFKDCPKKNVLWEFASHLEVDFLVAKRQHAQLEQYTRSYTCY